MNPIVKRKFETSGSLFEGYALKAAQSQSGKCNGYTEEHAYGMARHCFRIASGEISIGTPYNERQGEKDFYVAKAAGAYSQSLSWTQEALSALTNAAVTCWTENDPEWEEKYQALKASIEEGKPCAY